MCNLYVSFRVTKCKHRVFIAIELGSWSWLYIVKYDEKQYYHQSIPLMYCPQNESTRRHNTNTLNQSHHTLFAPLIMLTVPNVINATKMCATQSPRGGPRCCCCCRLGALGAIEFYVRRTCLARMIALFSGAFSHASTMRAPMREWQSAAARSESGEWLQ